MHTQFYKNSLPKNENCQNLFTNLPAMLQTLICQLSETSSLSPYFLYRVTFD